MKFFIPDSIKNQIPERVKDGPLEIEAGENQTVKVKFNKQTHNHRWARPDEGETETEEIFIIEPKKD